MPGVSLQFSRRNQLRHATARSVSAVGRTAPHAFTLLELLIVTGLIAAIACVVMIVANRTRAAATTMNCLGNMKQVTHALRTYAWDHENRFPDPGNAELPWEQMIQKYIANTGVLVCPADSEVAPVTGSSYDWRDTTLPEATLAGKLFTDCKRPDAVLTIEALPDWHERGKINVGRIDGSCATMDANEAMSDLLKAIR